MADLSLDKIAQEVAVDAAATPGARLLANAVLLNAIDVSDIEAENEALEKLTATLRGKLREAEGKLESAYQIGRDAVGVVTQEGESKLRELRGEYDVLVARMSAMEANEEDKRLIVKLRRDIKDYQERGDQLQAKVTEFRDNNIGLLTERDGIAEENEALTEELKLADAAIVEYQREHAGMLARATSAESAYNEAKERLQDKQVKMIRLEDEVNELRRRVDVLIRRAEKAEETRDRREEEIRVALANQRDAEAQSTTLRSTLDSNVDYIQRLQTQARETYQEIQALRARKDHPDVVFTDEVINERDSLKRQCDKLTDALEAAHRKLDDLSEDHQHEALLETINAQARTIADLQDKIARQNDGFEEGSIEQADAPVLVACYTEIDALTIRNGLFKTALARHIQIGVIGDLPEGPLGGVIVLPPQAKTLKRETSASTRDVMKKMRWLDEIRKRLAPDAAIVQINNEDPA